MAYLDKDYYLDKPGLSALIKAQETQLVAEEYSSSATYALGSYCIYDNLLYRCISAVTVAEAWTSDHWIKVDIGDELLSKEALSIVCTQAQYSTWETSGTLLTNVTYYVYDAPNNPEYLNGLGDVMISSPTNGQVFTYENGVWKNKTFDLSNYYTKSETYSKAQADTLLAAKANSADLAAVATSGSYNDLSDKPTIPAAQVNSDWNSTSGVSEILNKPTLGTAAAKDFTASVTSGSGDLVTSGAVYSAIDNLPEPMVFKGTLGTGGTITSLPDASSANEGFTYKVITAGTYDSKAAKVGDVFTSNATEWVLIPSGDETFTDTWRAIKIDGAEQLGSSITSGSIDFTSGSNVQLAFNPTGNVLTVSATDTTYTDATTSASGLMSATDKSKLDGIASGAEVNVNADWNAVSGDAQILNKPSIPDDLDDLSDVDTTGKQTGDSLVYDSTASKWGAKSVIVEVTQAQYDAMVTAGTVDPLVSYYIKDAPELQQPIIPPPPASNGNYYLKLNVNNGIATYTWVSAT